MVLTHNFFTGFDLAARLIDYGFSTGVARCGLESYGENIMFNISDKKNNSYSPRAFYEEASGYIGDRVMDIYGNIYIIEEPEPPKNTLVRQ